jgi:hypothetical protein
MDYEIVLRNGSNGVSAEWIDINIFCPPKVDVICSDTGCHGGDVMCGVDISCGGGGGGGTNNRCGGHGGQGGCITPDSFKSAQ